ncbi:YceD family protein [Actinomyces culturomici]|uniref:YceD family protein n=1 Tax=Actinomyces culturomici TaxID=1926276 RepID=UPI000E20C20B|nr:DUF177 domain-containing protein [Actinomyces culturomici]
MSESPLVLSLVALSRQIGSTRHEERTWIAPVDLGTPSMRVAPGSEVPLSIDLTSVDEGVLVRATTSVDLEGECVRCLDPVVAHHEIDASDVYFETAPAIDEEDPEADEVLLIGRHDTIDLEPLLRDAIITLVDDRPLCRPDCSGLCDVCGEKLDDLPEDHSHFVVDPRLASLQALLEDAPERPNEAD